MGVNIVGWSPELSRKNLGPHMAEMADMADEDATGAQARRPTQGFPKPESPK